MTGIQAAVITENNQTIQELHRCSSICMMHVKIKPSKVLLALPALPTSGASLNRVLKKRGETVKNIHICMYFTKNSFGIYVVSM